MYNKKNRLPLPFETASLLSSIILLSTSENYHSLSLKIKRAGAFQGLQRMIAYILLFYEFFHKYGLIF
jgi:hypothetical protein